MFHLKTKKSFFLKKNDYMFLIKNFKKSSYQES